MVSHIHNQVARTVFFQSNAYRDDRKFNTSWFLPNIISNFTNSKRNSHDHNDERYVPY